MSLTRRAFLRALAAGGALMMLPGGLRARQTDSWLSLLPLYVSAARGNIVQRSDGRLALLSSRLYPGMYIRDALFWGPLALNDPALGWACYAQFAEAQLPDGRIPTAIALRPEDAAALQPQADEGTLLFILASAWLADQGFVPAYDRLLAAYDYVERQAVEHAYTSAAGPYRYWADTLIFDAPAVIAHNHGLFCLARRAMRRMGLGMPSERAVQAAQSRWRAMRAADGGYLRLSDGSRLDDAQDMSAVFPEFLSRLLFDEPILPDALVVSHISRIAANASVYPVTGGLAGIKTISAADGAYLPQDWFEAPSLNPPGEYQNGGCWPLYTHVGLALAYAITRDPAWRDRIAVLVQRELAADGHTKEVLTTAPGREGTFSPERIDYTWNSLIPTALRWAGLAPA